MEQIKDVEEIGYAMATVKFWNYFPHLEKNKFQHNHFLCEKFQPNKWVGLEGQGEKGEILFKGLNKKE